MKIYGYSIDFIISEIFIYVSIYDRKTVNKPQKIESCFSSGTQFQFIFIIIYIFHVILLGILDYSTIIDSVVKNNN